MVFFGKNHSGRAQASTEFLLVLGIVLLISLTGVAMVAAWPGVLTATQGQRSDDYWSNAMPFSVTFHSMKPDTMIMAIVNKDPTTLTIKEIWLDDVRVDFFNHTVPYSSTANSRCTGGNCSMAMAPGVMQIVSTANITTSPPNPCGYGADFKYGADYGMSLRITYYGQNSNDTYSQNGTIKLIGTCSGWGGCEVSGCCGFENNVCCPGSLCNQSGLACDGTLCVQCGSAAQPCCSGSTCNANLACSGSPARCVCGSAAGEPCCSGTTCTGSGIACNSTSHFCQACGGSGQMCCAGSACTGASLICNATSSICTACGGAAGQFCCAGNDCSGGTNISCNATSTLCQPCGGSGQLCCAGNACNGSAYQCVSGTCALVCGGSGEACCPPNNTCNSAALGCNYNASATCEACGAQDQPCCAGTAPYSFECPSSIYLGCNIATHRCVAGCGIATAPCCGPSHTCTQGAGNMTCTPATDTCYRCGQYGGDPCCPSSPWNYCDNGGSAGCDHASDTCVGCGAIGSPCCGTARTCPYSGACNATDMCGVICGGAGEACCAGSTCNSGYGCNTTTSTCQVCGGTGQPCCTNSACNGSNTCISGACQNCGHDLGQACCNSDGAYICSGANITCSIQSGYQLPNSASTCVACGSDGQQCCNLTSCTGGTSSQPLMCLRESGTYIRSCIACGVDSQRCCDVGSASGITPAGTVVNVDPVNGTICADTYRCGSVSTYNNYCWNCGDSGELCCWPTKYASTDGTCNGNLTCAVSAYIPGYGSFGKCY